jgi:UPF0716 family protein affecting phage T7 exclusion
LAAQVTSLLRENALFLLVLLTLVAGFLLLRTRGADLGSLDEFDQLVSSGQPAVVEFYSNT